MQARTRAHPPYAAPRRHPSPTATPWIAAMLALATSSCEPTSRDVQAALVRDSRGHNGSREHRSGGTAGHPSGANDRSHPSRQRAYGGSVGVAADPTSDRIYLADWTGQRVAAFDASGAYAGSYGRSGDGPGEFRNPSAVSLDPDGILTVWDTGRQMLSRWSSEGELLNEQRPGWPTGVRDSRWEATGSPR